MSALCHREYHWSSFSSRSWIRVLLYDRQLCFLQLMDVVVAVCMFEYVLSMFGDGKLARPLAGIIVCTWLVGFLCVKQEEKIYPESRSGCFV